MNKTEKSKRLARDDQFKKIKKNIKGITLIALVVTVIVLLILAGVAINLSIGDNGIFKRAQDASKIAKITSEKEKIQMEIMGSLDNNGKLQLDTLKNNITKNINGEIVGEEFPITVKLNDSYFKVDSTGQIETIGISSKVTPENYGDKVENYSANGIDDWRIFYNDGFHVYLIATEYLLANKIQSTTGMNQENEYRTCWNSFPVTDLSNAKSNFLFSELSKVSNSNNSYKAVASLLDTTKWTQFKDTNGFAEDVIGSPTLEMWIASWNAKYGDTLEYVADSKGYELRTSSTDSLGYFIDKSIMSEGYQIAEEDNMYYPHKNIFNDNAGTCYGYWLASPMGKTDSSVTIVYYDGSINNNYYNIPLFAVRPVVCLKTNVIGTKNGDTWRLSF